MKQMTSRERVYAAVNRKETDRVPICFGGNSATVIEEVPPNGMAATQLYRLVGIKDVSPEYALVGNIVGAPDDRVIERLHSDFHYLYSNPPVETIQEDENTIIYPFSFGMRIKSMGGNDMIDFTNPPMKHITTEADIDEYPYWPPHDIDIMDGVIENARQLYEETDYFVCADYPFSYYPNNGYGFNSGMDKYFMDMIAHPELYHKIADRFLETNLAYLEQFYGQIGKYVDCAMVYDDLGTQQATLVSQEIYRKRIKPYQKTIIENIRKYLKPEAKIMIHSCGSIYDFIPDLIEIGIQILNPLQPLAKNMEPWRLKKEFGKDLAFLGGFDTQLLLPNGTKTEIITGVKKLLNEYAPGGGFVFAASINIQSDTPAENILTAFDTAYEFGQYPVLVETDEMDYVSYIRSLELGKREKKAVLL
jgi:uroporphyrinogen decarboxylase